MESLVLFSICVCIAVVVIWLWQFIQLMLLSDSDFPGKYDKILWVAAFLLVCVVAPFAFLWWKTAYKSMLDEGKPTDAERT